MLDLSDQIDKLFADAIDVKDTIWYSETETLRDAILSAIASEMTLLRQQIINTDKTPEYEYSEANARGDMPGVGKRWCTPRDIVKTLGRQ